MLISSRFANKHGHHRQFLFLIGRFLKNLLLCNHFAKWNETWWEASMEGHLYRLLISSPSINKHGCHRQFFFQVGRFLKIFPHWNGLAKWTATWWEAPMEGSVLNFLKTEWNVSNTCSAHWTSSFFSIFRPFLSCFRPALE